MVKKLTVIIPATITLLVVLAFEQTVIHPLVDTLTKILPCSAETSWYENCMNTKNILAVAPYLGTFGSIFAFMKKVGM